VCAIFGEAFHDGPTQSVSALGDHDASHDVTINGSTGAKAEEGAKYLARKCT
jgi:hypothetical protein